MKLSAFNKIKVGDKVTVSESRDATEFEVVELRRPGLFIREKPGNSEQYIDICFIRKHIKS